MGFRFRKSIKILPGIRLNISKSGVSTSLGGPGATINIGPKGTRKTVGLPGSGMSYSTFSSHGSGASSSADGSPANARSQGCGCLAIGGILILAVAMCSHKPEPIASSVDATQSESVIPTKNSLSAGPFKSGDTVYVISPNLNARTQPNTSARIVRHLRNGEALRVVESKGEWLKVAQGAALVWIASSHVSSTRTASAQTAQSLFVPEAGYAKPEKVSRPQGKIFQ